MKPHSGHLLQSLEAERVELKRGAAVFGIIENGHRVVSRTAGRKQKCRGYYTNKYLQGMDPYQETLNVEAPVDNKTPPLSVC